MDDVWLEVKKEYLRKKLDNEKFTLTSLAKEFDIKCATLRSRKNREKWDDFLVKNVEDNVATKNNSVATKNIESVTSNNQVNPTVISTSNKEKNKSVATKNKSVATESKKSVACNNQVNSSITSKNVSKKDKNVAKKSKSVAISTPKNEGSVAYVKPVDSTDPQNAISFSQNKTVAKKNISMLGNKNATGNNNSPPKKNQRAKKHGLFSKYMPDETLEIFNELENIDPIDLLWDNIKIQYSAIIRAQRIMFVKDKYDITKNKRKEKISETYDETEWEFQYAWDKHANFLKAQSRAMSELRSMIKRYDQMVNSNLATEEQRLRIEKLKSEVSSLNTKDNDNDINIIIRRKGV